MLKMVGLTTAHLFWAVRNSSAHVSALNNVNTKLLRNLKDLGGEHLILFGAGI